MCFQKIKLTQTNKNNPSNRARKLIRILGRLKQKVNKNEDQNKLTFSRMFLLKHWSLVHKCINKLIYNKVEGKNVLKRGIVVALKNSIIFACDALIFFYLMNRPNVEAKEKKEITDSLKQFLEQFNRRIQAIAFGNIGDIDLERRAANLAVEVLPKK